MAFIHGSDATITIDGDALTGYANSITFSREADSHDVTVFGATAKAYQAGLTDGTCTIEGTYDDGASGPEAILRPLLGAAAVALVYRPEGAGTGKPESTVNVIVTSYEESVPVADMITWSVELQCTGAITDATQS